MKYYTLVQLGRDSDGTFSRNAVGQGFHFKSPKFDTRYGAEKFFNKMVEDSRNGYGVTKTVGQPDSVVGNCHNEPDYVYKAVCENGDVYYYGLNEHEKEEEVV